MFGRLALLSLLLAGLVTLAESRDAVAGPQGAKRTEKLAEGPAVPASGAERPACQKVKVVYAGHGEAERAPCRAL